jgi:hypothetical protein
LDVVLELGLKIWAKTAGVRVVRSGSPSEVLIVICSLAAAGAKTKFQFGKLGFELRVRTAVDP